MSRVSRGFRLTGKIIKILFFTLIFSLIGILLWRMATSGDPKSMKTITVNDALYEAYEQKGDSLTVFRQNQKAITQADYNRGFFAITDCIFIPDANQIQIVFRYNNAAIRDLSEKYGMTSLPDRESDLYDVTLLLATDLTPEDDSDNKGNKPESVAFTRLHPVSSSKDQKSLYTYRRLVFDLDVANLSLSELCAEDGILLAAYIDVYYNQDIDYEKSPYGTLCIYDYIQSTKSEKLPSRDIKAIRAYRED